MSEPLPSTRRLELCLLVGTLLLYVGVTFASFQPDLIWDEGRYLWYAENLTKGFYLTPEMQDLINGPGYPLVLAPLIALKVPLLGMRMLNAVFMALTAWFCFRAVLPNAGKRWALAVALVTVLHPSLVRTAPYLMTEALAVCCTAGFAWAMTAALRTETWRWGAVVGAGIAFGWLILTRVFFGNVLLASTAFLVVGLLIWRSQRVKLLRVLAVMGLSFVICSPWLVFTKKVTGENLCWSTVSGELLYWITSTHEGENGHWFSVTDVQDKPELAAHHREFYLPCYALPVKEREVRFKQRALEQLRANPQGVFKNWLCNWSRLVFGFPRSFHAEELVTVVLILVNGPILLAIIGACLLGLKQRRTLPVEVVVLAGMTFIYLGGSSLAPALPRYAVVILPWLGFGIAAVLSKGLRSRVG